MAWNKANPHQHFPDWGSCVGDFFHNNSPFSTMWKNVHIFLYYYSTGTYNKNTSFGTPIVNR